MIIRAALGGKCDIIALCFLRDFLRNIFLPIFIIMFGAPTLALAQTSCPDEWQWSSAFFVAGPPNGITPDGGSVTWPLEHRHNTSDLVDVLFANLSNDTAVLTSSAPSIVRARPTGTSPFVYLEKSGSAVITATFANPACRSITLNITTEVTQAPTVADTSTTVHSDTLANSINLDVVSGYEIQSIVITTPPGNGQAVVSGPGTDIHYTPNAGFSGADSFTYIARNAAGDSNTATATILVEPEIVFSPTTLPIATVGLPYGPVEVGVSGGTPPYSVRLVPLSLPGTGLFVSGSDPVTFRGTLTAAGDYVFTLRATDANGFQSDVTEFKVTAVEPSITLSPSTLPQATASAHFTTQFMADGGAAPYTFQLTSGSVPNGLQFSASGELSGTPTETGTFSFTVEATDDNGFFGSSAYTLTVNAPDITVEPASLPSGTAGQTYASVTLIGDGGTAPYSFALTSGALPTGLSLGANGELSGTPSEAGNFSFTVTVTEANGFTGNRAYRLQISAPAITVEPDSVPNGSAGAPYSPTTFTAQGGTGPYTFTVTTGTLPAGLTLASNGTLSGTPTESARFTFGVSATDAQGFTGTGEYTIDIDAPEITVSARGLPAGVVNIDYRAVRFSATGGAGPYVFTLSEGAVPEGMTMTNEGTLSGTPVETGRFSFTVTATDNNGFFGSQEFSFAINAPDIRVSPDSLPDGSAGTAYGPVDFTASSSGAESGHFSFTVSAGELPDGLELSQDGALSGTPTQDGQFTFTVTATDSNGFTGSHQHSLTINAPEITLTVPALPDGKVNADYGPLKISASGGTEPYAFELASGELPEGMTLADDGTLSGTPTEDGEFQLTIRATDHYGFEGTARIALSIDPLNPPVVRNKTLEIMAGTRGSVDLTQGATGGPFTGATIVTHAAGESGEASIEQDGDTHTLHFAAAGTFAGTASLVYTLSNDDGMSEPATVTITVTSRPDPSRDPEVIGLIRAQAETAKRFADTQITNFNRRLEQLHDEGERRGNAIGVNLSVQRPTSYLNAFAPHAGAGLLTPASLVTPGDHDNAGSEPQSQAENQTKSQSGNLALWSGGYVNFGTNEDSQIKLEHTLVGVSGGIDYRFTPQLAAGVGFGYGRDVTDIGTNGTKNRRAEAVSLAAYGSYGPAPGIFIDGLAGFSTMRFDSRRFVTSDSGVANGSRDGRQFFASLSTGYEYRRDGRLISPYGRVAGSRSTLDTFTEAGADMWRLIYGRQTVDTLSGTLGLRLEYAIRTDWGLLSPRGRLEYTHEFEGASQASVGYADLGTTPYTLEVERFSRDLLTAELGLETQIRDRWNLGFNYRAAFGTNGNRQDHTLGIKVGVEF